MIKLIHNISNQAPEATPREDGQRKIRKITALVAVFSLALPGAAFAQTIDTSKIQAAVTSMTTLLQQLAGIFLVLLVMAGAGLIMLGGFNPGLQRTGIRGVSLAVIGAALVFLFAAPLSQFFVSTFTSTAA